MTVYKFVHAADLHLDSPFSGLLKDANNLATQLRDATFKTYDSIIGLCIEQGADALLIAGDVYDGATRSLRAQLRFRDGLQRLDEAGIRAFVCHGNHDPLDGWEAKIDFPPNVVRFGRKVTGEPLNPDDPKSPIVYGISYPTREVRDSLVSRFPKPESGRYCIGLLHANVGANTGHESYAPCTVEDLAGIGFDYWALGHVHTRAVLRTSDPMVAYPGNPQGRHINEAGERGVYVVEVDEQGGTTIKFHVLDAVRWERIGIDIDDLGDEQELFNAVEEGVGNAHSAADGRSLVYRLSFHGRGPVHATLARPGFIEELQQEMNAQFAVDSAFAFCERIEDESSAQVDRDELRQRSDLLGDLLRTIDETIQGDTELKKKLLAELPELYEHRTAGRYLGSRALEELDFAKLFEDAERLLVDELLDEESE